MPATAASRSNVSTAGDGLVTAAAGAGADSRLGATAVRSGGCGLWGRLCRSDPLTATGVVAAAGVLGLEGVSRTPGVMRLQANTRGFLTVSENALVIIKLSIFDTLDVCNK